MAGNQLIGPLPPVTLDAGCVVTFEAIDPNTGANVTGVTISFATLYAVNDDAVSDVKIPTPPDPLFLPLPLGQEG